ncbi:MAG: ABC transporter ATP-binding protein/permease [Oscillospiraceae bacterium]|nr:ABC transporter ATP-binding protein/permease [Oscillospiraceae bacterium]
MKKDFSRRPLAVFLSYFGPHWRPFLIDMLCATAVAVIDLVFPIVSRSSMQRLLPERLFTTFFVVMGIILIAYVVKGLLYYAITVVGHGMGVLVEADMRRDVFSHMQQLSFSFYDRNRTGVLMSRVTNDLFDITELSHHGPENVLICTLTIVGSLIVMFFIRWELALVLLVILPLCLIFTLRQRTRMTEASVEVRKKTAEINAAIESGISGVRTAKAFANENEEMRKFDSSNDVFKTARKGYYKAMGLFQSGMEFSTGAMQVIVILVGGILIMKGRMDYIDLVTFTLYVSAFVSPLRKLVMFMEQYTQGSAGFSRFLEIMRTEPEIRDAEDAVELTGVRGGVDYEGVSFRYGDGPWVLKDIDLSIRPGESFALVGASGGGKTTLCHLLPRFYDATEGRVLVDGRDVRSVTQESLRRAIGIIQQDVFMFAGTIRENIRYGRPDATDREVVEAAVRAEIHEEIMAMPDGYDTYIGERGVMLSGGQKQRVSIARVFLKDPPILILDEATSALDSVTEQKIQASLDQLSRGRTCIIIAHRLSTIRNADRIAVIEGESIAELGSHEELMAKNGIYASLKHAQDLAQD